MKFVPMGRFMPLAERKLEFPVLSCPSLLDVLNFVSLFSAMRLAGAGSLRLHNDILALLRPTFLREVYS